MSDITIRQAELKDLDLLAPLFDAYRQFYNQPSDLTAARQFMHERIQRGQSVVLLAFDGDRAVGFTQLYPSFSSVSLARSFVLNDFFVSDHCRMQGVGTKLLAAAVEYARSVRAIRLTLSTAATNTTAQSIYERTGWKRDQEFYVYHHTI